MFSEVYGHHVCFSEISDKCSPQLSSKFLCLPSRRIQKSAWVKVILHVTTPQIPIWRSICLCRDLKAHVEETSAKTLGSSPSQTQFNPELFSCWFYKVVSRSTYLQTFISPERSILCSCQLVDVPYYLKLI